MQPATIKALGHITQHLKELADFELHEGDDDAAEMLTHLAGECEDASNSGLTALARETEQRIDSLRGK